VPDLQRFETFFFCLPRPRKELHFGLGFKLQEKEKECTLLLIPVGKFFSAFDPSLVIKEQWAAVKLQVASYLPYIHGSCINLT